MNAKHSPLTLVVIILLAIIVSACGSKTTSETTPAIPAPTQTPYIIYQTQIVEAEAHKPTLTPIAPTPDPTPTPIPDWRTMGISDCTFPMGLAFADLNIKWAGTVYEMIAANGCAFWFFPGPYFQEVLAWVSDEKWHVSLPIAEVPALHVVDDTLIDIGVDWVEGQPNFKLYDARNQELITLSASDGQTVRVNRTPLNLHDYLNNKGPDNSCNWPNKLYQLNQLSAGQPESQEFVSFGWNMLDGCNLGYSTVDSYVRGGDDFVTLFLAENGVVTPIPIGILTHPWIWPQDNTGQRFYTNDAEFIDIFEGKATITRGNAGLMRYLIGETESPDPAVALSLYRQAETTPMINGSEFKVTGYARVDPVQVHIAQFQSNNKWFTSVIILDDAGYHGPVVIDNIREFTSWNVNEAGQIIGSYQDGNTVTFTINPDGSISVK